MELLLLKNLQILTVASSDLKTLTLARSLLVHPRCSPSTLHSVTKTLREILDRRRQDPSFLRHAIKILGDGALVHRSLIPLVIRIVRSFLNAEDDIAADALAVVDSLREFSVLDEDLVISFASSSIVSVRSRIVAILMSNCSLLRPELMLRVLLGLSADIYPSVRTAAVDGLVELLKTNVDWAGDIVVKSCYHRAVELLLDEEELVRSAVVKLVRRYHYYLEFWMILFNYISSVSFTIRTHLLNR